MLSFVFPLRRASWTLAFTVSLLIGSGSAARADAPLEGTKPAQWRVTWTGDPSTSATISWSTAKPGSTHSVHYRVKGASFTEGVRAAESGRFTGGETELYYHHVRLTELKPSTAYEVTMHSDQDRSPGFYFVTAPSDDRTVTILHGGDSRSDRNARRNVNAAIARMVSESLANQDPADDILCLAHGGDYIANGPNMTQWSQWLSDHELTCTDDGRLLPIIPARGNHDKGKPFNEVFGFADEDSNYYALNLSSQIRFVTLNTEASVAGDQANWLDEELQQSRGSHRWLLVQYHRPVYPAVKSPGSGLTSWVPLFEKHNVDLVCEADGHCIKRTVPIRNDKHDESGVVYIGEGGLGVPQRTPKADRWYLQSPGMTDRADHVFVLSISKQQLSGRCVLVDGTIRDEFTRPVRP